MTYFLISGFKKGKTFSMPSMLAMLWTIDIGTIKKNTRKNRAAAMMNLRTVSLTYGMARLSQ